MYMFSVFIYVVYLYVYVICITVSLCYMFPYVSITLFLFGSLRRYRGLLFQRKYYIILFVETLYGQFHNFKSQNFKLSVSNPNIKYVPYVSVLSQVSNSQGLGRNFFFETLKTYRTYIQYIAIQYHVYI